MALGWLTSGRVYSQIRWDMANVWDVPFAVALSGVRGGGCVFPEVARSKHEGGGGGEGGLTTTKVAQNLWFSNVMLNGGEVVGEDAWGSVTREGYRKEMEELVCDHVTSLHSRVSGLGCIVCIVCIECVVCIVCIVCIGIMSKV